MFASEQEYSQTCLKQLLRRSKKKKVFKTGNSLMQVKSVVEYSAVF